MHEVKPLSKKRTYVKPHTRIRNGKRVHVKGHYRDLREKWFHPKGELSGWSKDQEEAIRMQHLREEARKRGDGQITRRSLVSTGRAAQALANVTQDEETERKARKDAKELFDQAKQMD